MSLCSLRGASVLSAIVTVMATPRLMQAELPLDIYLPSTFLAMLLVSGTAVAWEGKGGLRGLLPEGGVWPWMGIAFLLSLLALPYYYYAAPTMRELLRSTGNAKLYALSYPDSLSGRMALMMWCGGFQTMFFYAAPMALFCRLVGRVWLAVVLTVLMQVLVMAYRFSFVGVAQGATPALCVSAVAATVASVLYAKAGLPATMTFVAGLNLHVFLF